MLSGKSSPVLTEASPTKESPYSQTGSSYSTGLYIPILKKNSGKLEDVFSDDWLDAMKSSSPPRKKLLKDIKVGGVSDDTDLAYSSWMVHELVGLAELHYAGSHGMDIMGPKNKVSDAHPNSFNSTDLQGKEVSLFQPAKEFLPMISEVFKILVEITRDIKGAKVEDHKFCACVHYRNVNEKSWPAIAQHVHDVLKNYPRLRLTHGRKVLEVRPVIDWDKGKAVEFILESLGLTNSDDVLPIYIGDDRTDEDAFKVLKKRNHGYGILVSPTPKETEALYSLKDPSEVKQFLKALVKWREQNLILPKL